MTLTRIAALAQTTASTVSRVLSNDPRISAATRDRVLATLQRHPYNPNSFARALKGGRTDQMGVLCSNISSGFFAEVLQGIDHVTREHGTHLLCSFAHDTPDYLQLAGELQRNGRTDGVILVDPPIDLFQEPLLPGGAPAVLCASRPLQPRSPWAQVDSVTVDNREAMRRLVAGLAAQGCRRLLHLAGPANTYDSRVRRAAFAAATRRFRGLQPAIRDGHLIESDGEQTAHRLLELPGDLPDALICFNDSTAQGVIRAFAAAGFPWRGRIAVTGWDDSPLSQHLDLATVTMPTGELGRQAAQALHRRILSAGPRRSARHVELKAEIQWRDSALQRKEAADARSRTA